MSASTSLRSKFDIAPYFERYFRCSTLSIHEIYHAYRVDIERANIRAALVGRLPQPVHTFDHFAMLAEDELLTLIDGVATPAEKTRPPRRTTASRHARFAVVSGETNSPFRNF